MPAARSKAADTKAVELERITDTEITVPIVGLTPLIPHKWAQKAVNMMRAKQLSEPGTTRPKREAKDPEQEAEDAMYRLPDGRPGIPSTAVKAAMVAACRFFTGVAMTEGRLMIFVRGEGPDQLVALTGTEVVREDTPRNATGVVDLRYRTALLAGVEGTDPWRADITVVFPPRLISESSILALLDAAGRVGVGDWRPGSPKSNSGTFGTFRIDDERAITRHG
jgi:hypothetical protein